MAINQDFQQLDFFTRAPRDVSKDVVDWSEITGKFVDFINVERDRRMAAKAEIDKNISTTLATMDNLDVGMDVDFNNFMFEGANNMRQYLLTQEKLLKSNQISVAEFKRNLTNTEGLVTNFKNYTTQYNEAVAKRDRMRMGVDEEGNPIEGGPILSEGDGWLMQHTGRYMDFGNAELVVGRDGTGGVVFTTGDPNRPYDISSTQSMGNLLNLSQQMFTAYNMQSDVTAFVDELGKFTEGGYYRRVSGQQLNEAFAPAKKDYIESIVESPEKLQSLASDYILKGEDVYEMYTTDESKMDDENALVFVTRNGYLQPAMDSKGWESIKTKARELLSNQIDAQTEQELQVNKYTRDEKKDNLNNIYARLDSFLETGNIEDLNSVATATGLDIDVQDDGSGKVIVTVGRTPYEIGKDGDKRLQLFSGIAEKLGLGEKHREIYPNYASGSYSQNDITGTALAPEADGGETNNMPEGLRGPKIKPYGGTVAQVSDYQSTPYELGFDVAFSNSKPSKGNATVEAKRKEVLNQAYGQLAQQLGQELQVDFDEASAEWSVRIGTGANKELIAKLSDDRTGKASLDNIILEDYNENLLK